VDAQGLVQFWGAKAVSALDPRTQKWGPWKRVGADYVLHTVEIGRIEQVGDQRHRDS
jgi:hypothetical protein